MASVRFISIFPGFVNNTLPTSVGIFTQGCPAQYGSWNGGQTYGGVGSREECDNLPSGESLALLNLVNHLVHDGYEPLTNHPPSRPRGLLLPLRLVRGRRQPSSHLAAGQLPGRAHVDLWLLSSVNHGGWERQ